MYWEAAKRLGLPGKLAELGSNVAVQGELVGSTIEGNTMGFAEGEHAFYVFEIDDIDRQRYWRPDRTLKACARLDLPHVPVVSQGVRLCDFAGGVEEVLRRRVEGVGIRGRPREGLVFKTVKDQFAFKAISNSWLLEKERMDEKQEEGEAPAGGRGASY
ncbi:MAG: hypothetical protein OK454_05600 [Thaumarchaeota archaeon]|nr:hypothetical protein [Nitrososphaerota archaeon]